MCICMILHASQKLLNGYRRNTHKKQPGHCTVCSEVDIYCNMSMKILSHPGRGSLGAETLRHYFSKEITIVQHLLTQKMEVAHSSGLEILLSTWAE